MKWPEGKWPYLFLTVIALLLTRGLAPDVADWMLTSIEDIVRLIFNAIPTIGEKS